MQNFKFDFLENELWADWAVRTAISGTLRNFSTEIFSMYREY